MPDNLNLHRESVYLIQDLLKYVSSRICYPAAWDAIGQWQRLDRPP